MNPKEYQQLALVTKSKTDSLLKDVLHAGCGLLTEPGEIVDQYKRHWFYGKELDVKNIKEEIGDTLWYIAIAFYGLEEEMPKAWPSLFALPEESRDLLKIDPNQLIVRVVKYGATFFSMAESASKYGLATQAPFLLHEVTSLLTYLSYLADTLGYSIEQAAIDNIEKLKKRYPDGFTQFAALNRDTVNELSHIQQ